MDVESGRKVRGSHRMSTRMRGSARTREKQPHAHGQEQEYVEDRSGPLHNHSPSAPPSSVWFPPLRVWPCSDAGNCRQPSFHDNGNIVRSSDSISVALVRSHFTTPCASNVKTRTQRRGPRRQQSARSHAQTHTHTHSVSVFLTWLRFDVAAEYLAWWNICGKHEQDKRFTQKRLQ